VTRGLVFAEAGARPAVEEITLEPVGAGEVQVRVEACGVCHTDLHVVETRGWGMRFPILLGHEGAAVAVIGCGGVGLAVVQGARLAGAAAIVAVDVVPEKHALALELGATHAVDASGGDAVAQVRELTDGVDFAFSAITAPAGLVDAVRMCAYAGTATLVGVPPPGRTLDLDPELDLFHPKVAIAVTHGGDTIPQQDFPFLAQAALAGKLDLDRFVTKTISLDEVPDALDALHTPQGVRTVVQF
jgi:S-(hydroxymethyl)mycothiol dehydrogenase